MSLSDMAKALAGSAPLPGFAECAAQQRALDERAAWRKVKRATLGGCECGEVTGEALCSWCDRTDLPEHIREFGATLRLRDRARDTLNVAEVMKALAGTRAKAESEAIRPRVPNRFERRRAASRKWK